MASDIEISSNAMIRIGAPPISSFTEGGAQGIAAGNLYAITVKALLSTHPWRFAMGKVLLNQLVAAPLNDYQYAYQLPGDMLKLWRVYQVSDYQIYEDKLYTNANTVEIDYVFQPVESKFPASFQLALEYKLAAEFAMIITSNRTLAEGMEEKARVEATKARSIDSLQTPAVAVQSYDYINSRA